MWRPPAQNSVAFDVYEEENQGGGGEGVAVGSEYLNLHRA